MTKQKVLQELEEICGSRSIKTGEPMSRHTTFRIGGPAEIFVEPQPAQIAQVIACCGKYQVPYTVIGNGSNLLVGDGGIEGVVVCVGRNAANINVQGTRMEAQAGALLSVLAGRACEEGLCGLEFAAGIPGSVGGAVVMNAGAYDGEIRDVIVSARILTAQGEELVWNREELGLSYRHSRVMEEQAIVLSAEFELHPAARDAIRARMEELKIRRVEKQPLEYPSAGSTFKRPQGYFAGKLIMDAGLRGYRVGDAQVSEKHCGFVINRGAATAAQVRRLMSDVTEKVREVSGVELEPEVRYVGRFLQED